MRAPPLRAKLTPVIAYSELGQRAQPPTIARLMTLALENPRLLSLAAGFTDNHTLPVGLVSTAVATLAKTRATTAIATMLWSEPGA